MGAKVKYINLLPKKSEGYVNQFLGWALTIGRLLIIITETLALAVFLYRFALDVKIVDLHDQIKNQSLTVKQFKTTETSARDLQARLALIKKYDSTSKLTPDAFADIIELGRGDVTFKNITVGTEAVKIEVQSARSSSLSSFISKLKKYPALSSISIASVVNKTTSGYIKINILAKLKTASESALKKIN